jgi:hypothetical protein
MEVKNEIINTLKEVCCTWKLEDEEFKELDIVSKDNFQSLVKKLVKNYYLYFVMLYEESLNKLHELREEIGNDVRELVLRHKILQVYLDGGVILIK